MTLTNLRVVKDEQAIQEQSRAAIQAYHIKPDELSGQSSHPVSRRRHLDVDAVLARSLRKVTKEEA